MSAEKYPSTFSRQMEAIVYIFSRQMEAIVYIFVLLLIWTVFAAVGCQNEAHHTANQVSSQVKFIVYKHFYTLVYTQQKL